VTLLRVYAKMDSSNKIALPRGIRKSMDIRPGEKLELTIAGTNKEKKLLVTKPRRRCLR
jgi:bifunctional DNA-binding transcriptional regulator/antitoxin component of YhaV-PrlF toxin-antitoxin module